MKTSVRNPCRLARGQPPRVHAHQSMLHTRQRSAALRGTGGLRAEWFGESGACGFAGTWSARARVGTGSTAWPPDLLQSTSSPGRVQDGTLWGLLKKGFDSERSPEREIPKEYTVYGTILL